jgi:hypothetical protein
MRLRSQYGTYWIDAICINQKRNHQVQMMQQIYSNAQSVAVWLGDTDDASLADTATDFVTPYVDPSFDLHTLSWDEQLEASVLALCTRKYWTRVWIVQELLLAKDGTIYCGSKRLPWQTFQSFITDVKEDREELMDWITTTRAPSESESEVHRFPYGMSPISTSPAVTIVKGQIEQREREGGLRDLITQYQASRSDECLGQGVCAAWVGK